MQPSSLTKTSSSSASDPEGAESAGAVVTPDAGPARATPRLARRDRGRTVAPPVELRDVALKFVSYQDKTYSLKRAVIDLLLSREDACPTDEFWALRGINLRIEQGERVGVLGHNGAGTSTLLRLMAR